MAESTRVSPEELERREKYLRAGLREVNLMDPFTWSYPLKGAGVMVGASLISAHLYNIWNKRPFYYAIVPRLIGVAVMGAVGYGMGSLREHHYKTRDAVIQHYIELHPKDFDHFNDSECLLVQIPLGRINSSVFNITGSGRPFSQILLPWYPRRTQYTKYD
ncbi:hypothetical protein Aduo_008020 [Ancylostoma duodenale]